MTSGSRFHSDGTHVRLRFIPTGVHAGIEYSIGFALLYMPLLSGLNDLQRWSLIELGAVLILYNFFTDHSGGLLKFLSLRFHLNLDFVFAGIAMFIPMLLKFPDAFRWPIYLIGLFIVALSICTKIEAEADQR